MMESIEKLRDELRICEMTGSRPTIAFVAQCADEIEREIAERYMLLPVDADGVPIHVGDRLTNINKPSDEYTVAGVNGEKLFVYGGHAFICASQCRRVKPRTIEDVLHDFWEEWESHPIDVEWGVRLERLRESEAKYADEIRELMEVDG